MSVKVVIVAHRFRRVGSAKNFGNDRIERPFLDFSMGQQLAAQEELRLLDLAIDFVGETARALANDAVGSCSALLDQRPKLVVFLAQVHGHHCVLLN